MQKTEDTETALPNILVFGGTIEGRRVSEYLASRKVPHTVCVATEYGEEVLCRQPLMQVHQGRMDAQQMRAFLRAGEYAMVVDATHPYAVEVSKNIREACEKEHVHYLRFLRAEENAYDGAGGEKGRTVLVNSAKEAAEYLETQQGRIFLTTGSKELHVFTEGISEKSRLFARVLPSAEVITSCRALGLEGKQICAMQGPFSSGINEAMLRQVQADFLVTKDTGVSGGFPEKIEAARRCGITAVIIRRPEEAGYSWEEIRSCLEGVIENCEKMTGSGMRAADSVAETGFPDGYRADETECQGSENREPEPRQISCIGIGMGTPATLTREAAQAIQNAQILFGAKRILESAALFFSELYGAPGTEQSRHGRDASSEQPRHGSGALSEYPQGEQAFVPEMIPEYRAEQILAYLNVHPQYRRAAILMSGDVGFYSGARQVAEVFPEKEVRYYCGISSVVYFASRIPTAWQDAKLLSAHGKNLALLNYVRRYPKLILLVSGARDVERLCRELCDGKMNEVRVTVGSNLSYPEERITAGSPEDFLTCGTNGLHIMMVENERAGHVVTPGIPDDAFVRGRVPMTKEEIRILSVAKLRLREDSVVYDVGAGTGSVSIECARLCTSGCIYAIERNPEGIALIRENSRKIGVSNLCAVEGLAPAVLQKLPAPTHAFIGGSSGNIREIIETLRQKNPSVRVVINTIAMESIAEVMTLLRELDIRDADIVQVSAAKARVLGNYHMMTAHNPVYIVSFGTGAACGESV